MSQQNPNTKQLLKLKTKRQNQEQETNKRKKSLKNNNFIFETENDNESESEKSKDSEADEDISKWTKQENSLSQLTQSFLNYIKKKGRVNISINDLVTDLNVKKRRIYDITNVLQGIGYLEKKGKNEILWIKDSNTISIPNDTISSKDKLTSENYISNYAQLKKELDDLKSKKNAIDDQLNKYREEFKIISQKNEFPKYGYITFDDITNLSINEKVNFMLIKAPKGTSINVIDDEESRKAYIKIKTQMGNGKIKKDEKLLKTLENVHHIFFTSQDKELKIYKIDNGKIKEQLCEEKNNDNFLYQNLQNNFVSNSYDQKCLDNQNNEKGSSEQNNSTIFNFDQIKVDNSNKQQNTNQIFTFDNNNNIKQNLNNKNDLSANNKNTDNIGISSIFKV